MALIDKIAKSSMNSNYGSSKGQPSEVFVIPGAVQDIPRPNAFGEIGVSGVLRTRGVGYVYEEWLLDLGTYRQKQIYREMRDNDAVIGALFFALEMILRKAEWHVEQADGDKDGKYAQFVEECMEDMSHTWEDFIAECVNMFAFGYSLFETVYKRRLGPDGRSASKYKDGLIGWRKHAPRAQESILYWIWDDAGGLQGAVQLAAPDYHTVPIPIEKLLLFRTTSIKNNPEGRALDPETLIPTPDGWRKLDELRVGNKIFDEYGRIAYVNAWKVWKNRPRYEITFGDGSKMIADENHLWKTSNQQEREKGLTSKLRTMKEIYSTQKTTQNTSNHSIEWAKPLDYPEQILPVDPYFLGYWLGNGGKNGSGVSCHVQDAVEIAELISVYGSRFGYKTVVDQNGEEGGNGRRIKVQSQERWDSSCPSVALRILGVLNNKHIPANYLHGSVDQRLMLLAGLMDSDGTVDQWGRCTFSNTNMNLIHGVAELVRSLGVGCSVRLGHKANSIDHMLDAWGVRFTPPWSPFKLKRKAKKTIAGRSRSVHYISSVKKISNGRTVCIETSASSHMFLAGENMVPTHNSLLRNCYRTWFFKRRIEEVEGIGIERDLCGIPVLYCTQEALEAMGGQAEAIKLVTNIRVDDQAGVVLPLAYDEKGNPLVKLELLKAAGSKQTDAGATIGRYNSDILNTVLAGFVQFGQGPTGSRALHMSATQIFSLAITAYMDGVAGVMNRIAIPRLMKLNKFPQELSPKIVPGEIGIRDLDELSMFIQQLSQSGLTFFDQPTQDYLRKVARLPATPKDDEGKPVDPSQDPNGTGQVDPQAFLQTLQTQLQNGSLKFQDVQRILNTQTHPQQPGQTKPKLNGVPQQSQNT